MESYPGPASDDTEVEDPSALTDEEHRTRRAKRRADSENGEAAAGEPSEEPEISETAHDQAKDYGTILEEEIFQGMHEMRRPAAGLLLSGLSAGLDVGLSVLVMATVVSIMGGNLSQPATRLLVAATYPVGFIFVILGRSELFTEHTTLAVFPVLGRRATLRSLGRLWALTYTSNLVGAAAIAAMLAWIGPALDAFMPAAVATLADVAVRPRWPVILGSGILAGWMMGLLSWLVSAAQETVSRIIVVWLVTAAIGVAGLHHCILGTVEVLTSVFLGVHSLQDYGHFLLWASVGNAAGGVIFVAVIKYGHAVRGPQRATLPSPGESPRPQPTRFSAPSWDLPVRRGGPGRSPRAIPRKPRSESRADR